MTTFFVPSIPGPQGSKSPKGRRKNGSVILVESSKKVAPFRAAVAAVAAMRCAPNPGPVALVLEFVMPRPQALPKTRPTPPAIKRNGDIDKLSRAVLDALSGHAYLDDAQVIDLRARKRTAEPCEAPGVHIQITYPTQETAA